MAAELRVQRGSPEGMRFQWRAKRVMYRVEYIKTGGTNWTLAADTNMQSVAIDRGRSVAREPRREKVRVVDANGSVIWMS